MAKWRGTQKNNPNGVNSSEIQQHLTLGQEPQAQVSFSLVKGNLDNLAKGPDKNLGTVSDCYCYNFKNSINGEAIIATYSNLKHSFYVDDNGKTHHLSKLVRTFSDLTSDPNVDWSKQDGAINGGKPYLRIFEDPTEGFIYDNLAGITYTDQYYDENGKIINFEGNAYLAVTSLNNGTNGDVDHEHFNDAHIEKVKAVNNAKAFSLAGSSITLHNGNTLYSDNNNSSGTGENNMSNWDNKKSPNQYYGAGLMRVHGDSFTLRFEAFNHSNLEKPVGNVWATTTTIIPATPTPKRKTTQIHYHYDVGKR